MLNTAVSMGNVAASRIVSGMLAICLDHPLILCLTVSGVAGAAVAVLLDVIGPRAAARSDRPT